MRKKLLLMLLGFGAAAPIAMYFGGFWSESVAAQAKVMQMHMAPEIDMLASAGALAVVGACVALFRERAGASRR